MEEIKIEILYKWEVYNKSIQVPYDITDEGIKKLYNTLAESHINIKKINNG